MARDLTKTAICRIAAIRSRSAYVTEKAKLVFEVREARKRGEDPRAFLATLEQLAVTETLLGDDNTGFRRKAGAWVTPVVRTSD